MGWRWAEKCRDERFSEVNVLVECLEAVMYKYCKLFSLCAIAAFLSCYSMLCTVCQLFVQVFIFLFYENIIWRKIIFNIDANSTCKCNVEQSDFLGCYYLRNTSWYTTFLIVWTLKCKADTFLGSVALESPINNWPCAKQALVISIHILSPTNCSRDFVLWLHQKDMNRKL